MTITPQKIELVRRGDLVALMVYAPECVNGSTCIESARIRTGRSIPGLRKQGANYAKRFGIQFVDRTLTAFNSRGQRVAVTIPTE